ncbi:unnamed protein product [Ectocarpus sp. 13 AM-2016]
MSSGSSGNAKPSASTPVKWTLVEAVAETPEGRRHKHQSHAGQRKGPGARGSGYTGSWGQGRDGGRGRGGGQGYSGGNRGQRRGGGAGSRNNQGQGRGRGYGGGYVGGATYYPTQANVGAESFEEQKAYMTNLAVRQIEFYFTVENLCRDIFMRSYMDEEGYIPIAFVANFPGVARFGVELEDITAGILASDTLQVDTENETMRMREGWEVWLLPNQATGKQGVPRYIKVDPTVSEADRVNGTEPGGIPAQTTQDAASAGDVPDAEDTQTSLKEDSTAGAEKKEGESVTGPVAEEEQQSSSEKDQVSHEDGAKTELTPLAPAWTPVGASTDAVQEQSSPPGSPTAVPPPDQKAPEEETGRNDGERETDEPAVPTAELKP